MQQMQMRIVGLSILLALAWLFPAIAWAHAFVTNTDPPQGAVLDAAPSALKITYSEAIEPKFSTFTLYDGQGNKLPDPTIEIQPDGVNVTLHLNLLDKGTYTLAWKAISRVDGHLTKGVYPFSIGVPGVAGSATSSDSPGSGQSINPVEAVVRWLEFLMIMVIVGGLFFSLLVLRSLKLTALEPHVQRLYRVALVLFIIGSLIDLLIQATTLSEASLLQILTQGTLIQLLLQTRYGVIWLMRMGFALLLGAWILRKKPQTAIDVILGSLILLSLSLSSHSAAVTGDVYLAIFSDWGHLMAASFWVGGLLQFAMLLFALRSMEKEEKTKTLASISHRFYQLAFISGLLLLLAGFHLTLIHIPNLGTELTTPYGEVYLIKHLLLLALVLVAAANLLFGWPRKSKTPLYILRLEALIAAAIVFCGGLLTLLPPAATGASTPIEQAQAAPPNSVLLVHPADKYIVALSVSPATVGLNAYDVLVTDADGKPVDNVQRLTLTFRYSDNTDIGDVSAITQPAGFGHYKTQGAFMTFPGQWEIAATLRFSGLADDITTALPIRLQGDSKVAAPPITPEQQADIDAGKIIYTNSCMGCHGVTGLGEGPAAASLSVPPANLQLHMQHHTDESLLDIIRMGKQPVMPPFGNVLSDAEIAQLIRYLRDLTKPQ
ncbi:copper resistance protein CopC [Candidatus Acetothermia bacterium]|nr:copper resistance protein CopC [Candidatus Acetothermia bacterium]MBI3644276.1 copper resistance protein CopC [Candidatus Acetothermia bacterium]